MRVWRPTRPIRTDGQINIQFMCALCYVDANAIMSEVLWRRLSFMEV